MNIKVNINTVTCDEITELAKCHERKKGRFILFVCREPVKKVGRGR